jgi:hypothetical protein
MKHSERMIRYVILLAFLYCFIPPGSIIYSQELIENVSLTIVEKVYLHTDRDAYYPGDDIWFSAYLIDGNYGNLTPNSTNLHVELISPSGKIILSRIVRLNSGLGSGDFHLADTIKSGGYFLRAYTNYMRNSGEETFFTRRITLLNSSGGDDVVSASSTFSGWKSGIMFFPEGGSLVSGVVSEVAFKAFGADGMGCGVLGEIFDDEGQHVAVIKSVHNGIGKFSFEPESGKNYYSVAITANGDTIREPLPSSFPAGVVMNVTGKKDGLLSIVFRTNSSTFVMLKGRELSLTVSKLNNTLETYSFMMSSLNSHLKIPTQELPDGIVRLTLTGSDELPICERLVFVSNNENVSLKIETGKGVYNLRDSVSVIISLTDSLGSVNDCSLSLSAADKMFTGNHPESVSNIASWFLLESEIKGEVEEPGYYFDRSNYNRKRDLDLLLLTHGWRDFRWKYDRPEYLTEHGFTISGRVRKKFSDTPVKNCWVSIGLFKGGNPLIKMVPVSMDGKFSLEKLDIRGRVKMIASVTGDDDKLKGWLQMDSMRYIPADIVSDLPSGLATGNFGTSEADSLNGIEVKRKFIQYADIKSALNRQYKLTDTIFPGEVMITARKDETYESARSRSRRYLMGTPDREIVITPQLHAYGNPYLLISNRYMSRKTIPVFGLNFGLINPVFMIDGVRVSADEVKSVPMNWVERIDIIDNPTASLIRGIVQVNDSTTSISQGVVSIILKGNNELDNLPEYHSVNTTVSGFDEPRIFYSPCHKVSLEKDYKPDVRSTLFWKPDIVLKDQKEQLVNFYNSDNPGRIRIVAEGITGTGIPVSASVEYEVR